MKTLVLISFLVFGCSSYAQGICAPQGMGNYIATSESELSVRIGTKKYIMKTDCTELTRAESFGFVTFAGSLICEKDTLFTLDYMGNETDRCWILKIEKTEL